MRRTRTLVIAALGGSLLTGCVTGQRPTLQPARAEIADPAIAAVLQRLEAPRPTQLTATYDIVTKITTEQLPTTAATFARADASSTSVTIGSIRFLDLAGTQATCDLATAAPCEPGLLDARVSNLLVGHDFAGASPAARLRQDAQTMINAATPSTRVVAGQTATCAQVDFAAGSKVYCAIDDGLLAYQDSPDIQVTLVGLVAGADQALFVPPG